jgi:serine phosphatase RsbU (regulator of sigma subunit)
MSLQRQSSPLSILLVEDQAESLALMGAALEPLQLDVVHAGSEQQAMARLQDRDFALVLLAVNTAGLDVARLTAAMRMDARTEHVPLIYVGTDARVLQTLSGMPSGIVDHMNTPVDPAYLRAKVNLFCDLFRQGQELAERNRQLQNALELATRVHEGFLPVTLPVVERLLCSRYHKTCATLGGDLHDVFPLARGRIGLYMADVAGHGVSAALLSGLVKMSFETLKEHIDLSRLPVSELLDPGVMLTRTNAAMHGGLASDVFITLQYAVIDPRAHTLRISTAGHPFPLYYKAAEATATTLRFPSGPALGPFRDAYFPVATVELRTDDKLVFFTDGLIEAMNGEGEEFGIDRLLDVVKVHGRLAPDALVAAVVGELDIHRGGAPLSDDCSLLIVQMK